LKNKSYNNITKDQGIEKRHHHLTTIEQLTTSNGEKIRFIKDYTDMK
jgi:hypothetical protein